MQDMVQKTLYDKSACKCLNFKQCTCKLKNSATYAERNIWSDQRLEQYIVIPELDITATKANRKYKKV